MDDGVLRLTVVNARGLKVMALYRKTLGAADVIGDVVDGMPYGKNTALLDDCGASSGSI